MAGAPQGREESAVAGRSKRPSSFKQRHFAPPFVAVVAPTTHIGLHGPEGVAPLILASAFSS